MQDCNRCEYIMLLGDLPSLRILEISQMKNVKCLGSKFYHVNTSTKVTSIVPFPSLKKLFLKDMPNLLQWMEVFPSFPCLEELRIINCPKLKVTPNIFPLLKVSDFSRNNSLTISVVPSLTHITICDCPELMFLPEGLLQSNTNVLQFIEIFNCPKLEIIIPNEKEVGPPLVLPSLESLVIHGCPILRSLPNLWGWTSLKTLVLSIPKECKSPPEGFQCLTMLEELRIGPLFKSLPEGFQCLTMLKELTLGTFSKELDYFPRVEDLQHLVSLSSLWICGWPKLKTLPNQLKQLTGLAYLYIDHFDGLVALPDWLGNLASLQNLHIYNCKSLMYLPEEEVMRRLTSLNVLRFISCPLLKERCAKERGVEWHKIAHIPFLFIFNSIHSSPPLTIVNTFV